MNFKKIIFILCVGVFLSVERNANAQIATFNYSGAITNFTVPCGVTQLTMTAIGATGGNVLTFTPPGGKGAEMIGTFVVVPGQVLKILVGGAGANGTSPSGGGGGGGGTFITTSTNAPLLIAGGGGGVDAFTNAYVSIGIDAVTTNNGVNGNSASGGSPTLYGIGGVGGNGATNNSSGPCAGNGGGLLTNGAAPGCCNGTSGFAFVNGGAGGPGCVVSSGNGGFGGGGGGGNTGGGGGGGYGGGGGSYNDPVNGGGGGSFNNGSSQSNTAAFNAGGNGQVIITWTVPTSPVVTASVVSNVTCHGGNNGSATETVTGGSSPFTYLWTPTAQTTSNATALTAGTYTIKVTDNCGNSASASVTITQPNALAVTATTTTNELCNGGNNGGASSTPSGGTTPYTYSWAPAGGSNANASGLTAGTYTITVKDGCGASATASATITQPTALSVAASTTTNVLCNGGSTGSASSTVSGGTGAYTYLWLPSGGTNSTASGLTAGTYVLSVSDKNGCTGTAAATITQPAAISLTSASTPDNGSGNGTATVTASGGTSPYNYLWTPSGKTTAAISGEAKGTYCCKVTDANGCKDSTCVTIKSTSGVDGIAPNSGQIIVYPNPNNGQFTIKSSVGGASTVEIYNVLGEKVFTKSLSSTEGTNTIDISNQSSGVYLYRVISVTGDLLGEGKITLQK